MMLRNVQSLVGLMFCHLMLQPFNELLVQLQQRNAHALKLQQNMKRAISKLESRFITAETRFAGETFEQLQLLLSGEEMDNGLVLVPDSNGDLMFTHGTAAGGVLEWDALAPPDRSRGRSKPVPSLAQQADVDRVVASLKEQAIVTATQLAAEARARLPECALIEATKLCHPEVLKLPIAQLMSQLPGVLEGLRPLTTAARSFRGDAGPPPLDLAAFEQQLPQFLAAVQPIAAEIAATAEKHAAAEKRLSAAKTPAERVAAQRDVSLYAMPDGAVAELWRRAEQVKGLKEQCPEVFKYAEVCIVLVQTSVEDEARFSNMKYLKNKQRNRLGEEHCELSMRMFVQPFFKLAAFPVVDAVRVWMEAANRRMVS